jgi:hypothetical protein
MAGTVSIEGGSLVFELHGIDEILSIKRTIKVPLEHVTSVSTERVTLEPKAQIKLVGARIPTVVKDGRFLTSEGMMFFEMHDPDKCITVSLNHERYKKIVFEVDDKEKAAKQINEALKWQPKHSTV